MFIFQPHPASATNVGASGRSPSKTVASRSQGGTTVRNRYDIFCKKSSVMRMIFQSIDFSSSMMNKHNLLHSIVDTSQSYRPKIFFSVVARYLSRRDVCHHVMLLMHIDVIMYRLDKFSSTYNIKPSNDVCRCVYLCTRNLH